MGEAALDCFWYGRLEAFPRTVGMFSSTLLLCLIFFVVENACETKVQQILLSLHVTSRSEEANKAFSAAVQMHDVLVKAWAMWGDYLENIFVKERQLHLGVSAITCYLHACRHQNESKSRKYLAKNPFFFQCHHNSISGHHWSLGRKGPRGNWASWASVPSAAHKIYLEKTILHISLESWF
ncbi:Transformation/transcription domain-associated protein [Varanus komodoensis]|nr:Transformation/transcription domain-associated protein [Varanus komodoensis]